MHISQQLQIELREINSSIELAKTIDNELPSRYAFYKPLKQRNFRVEFGETNNRLSIVLFDRTHERNYEYGYLRGQFDSIKDLAQLIKSWVEDEEHTEKVAIEIGNLELFQNDEIKNPNYKIEERWIHIKNRIFNNTKFWENPSYETRYYRIILAAKQKSEWHGYYPFTSHDWLRFSLNENLTETWELGLHIIPTWKTDVGNYYVGIPDNQGHTFECLDEAIAFYDEKLKELAPINWKKK